MQGKLFLTSTGFPAIVAGIVSRDFEIKEFGFAKSNSGIRLYFFICVLATPR
jgi:hypothetical protein